MTGFYAQNIGGSTSPAGRGAGGMIDMLGAGGAAPVAHVGAPLHPRGLPQTRTASSLSAASAATAAKAGSPPPSRASPSAGRDGARVPGLVTAYRHWMQIKINRHSKNRQGDAATGTSGMWLESTGGYPGPGGRAAGGLPADGQGPPVARGARPGQSLVEQT